MATATYAPRLKGKYQQEVIPALMKRFGYKSIMQVPKLEKIAINRGVNGAVTDKKLVDIALDELTTISGQKAVSTMSKNSYIFTPRSVTLAPIGMFLRSLKFEMSFLDMVATAF